MGIHIGGVHDGGDRHVISTKFAASDPHWLMEATTLIGPAGSGTFCLVFGSVWVVAEPQAAEAKQHDGA